MASAAGRQVAGGAPTIKNRHRRGAAGAALHHEGQAKLRISRNIIQNTALRRLYGLYDIRHNMRLQYIACSLQKNVGHERKTV